MGGDNLAQFDQAMDVGRVDPTGADRDGGFHHRQRHALGAVAEQREVALLGGQHRVVHALVGKVDIAPDDLREELIRLAVIAFAVPQRVVAVETDQLQHAVSPAQPTSRPSRRLMPSTVASSRIGSLSRVSVMQPATVSPSVSHDHSV